MFKTQVDISEIIKKNAQPLQRIPQDVAPVMPLIANKHFILLGEATHGTHEFYAARVEITKRLILQHGLTAIAIEGDWPSAYRVNEYVRCRGTDTNPNEALSNFQRFPLWMWRNQVVLDFIIWLREHNENLPPEKRVGFYGLDMYSLFESVSAVLEYLDQVDPEAARDARTQYACLEHFGSGQHYGYGVILGKRPSCKDEVIRVLTELHRASMRYAKEGDLVSEDDQFQAEQNARLVKSAESYYRQMFDRQANTWNLRDAHMFETLQALHTFLSQRNQCDAKIAVWEHNSHLGDARATYMSERTQYNLGQLVRQAYTDDCALIGFTTYSGTVTAASEWDGPAYRKTVRPALPNSVENIFHNSGMQNFFVPMVGDLAEVFSKSYLQRAIGVLYLPQTERASHYFDCRLANQFDAIFHFDETTALEPLDSGSEWIRGEEATYPFGV